jgi:hypothetical protein
MIRPDRFTRKTFTIEAVLVSRANMHEVAEWCGGKVNSTFENGQHPNSFIRVPIALPRDFKPDMAFPGKHWVLRTNNGFSVYTLVGFENSFVSDTKNNAKRYADVDALVKSIMYAQDQATRSCDARGLGVMRDTAVRSILKLL